MNKNKSILFITFHKAASSLFGDQVLNNLVNMKAVDFSSSQWKNYNYIVKSSDFEENNFVYGPIRISSYNPGLLQIIASKISRIKISSNIRNKIDKLTGNDGLIDIVENLCPDFRVIFMTRDPRDILVSAYYSFKKTHALSLDKRIS
jgi:hypothetical protein